MRRSDWSKRHEKVNAPGLILSVFFYAVRCIATEPHLAGSIQKLSVQPAEVRLTDARARQQLIVTAHATDGSLDDLTRDVLFESGDQAIAEVDKAGVVWPRQAGTTKVRVTGFGKTAEVTVVVGDLGAPRPVSFANEVMAVLGKAGCNAGACHGHNSGKGGFKLSLRGYDPKTDHGTITADKFERIDPKAPEESLILLKPTKQNPHKGGKRFEVGSASYELLLKWVTEGAQSDVGRAPRVERIEVFPPLRVMPRPGMQQQLIVLAHFADGSVRDVTHEAIYELSSEGVITVNAQGLISSTREGEAAVLVRWLGQMGLGRCIVFQQKPDFLWSNPPINNFIDEHIYSKLKTIQVNPSELSIDAEFHRRVWLDTLGVPPTPEEAKAFLSDTAPEADKRARVIDALLEREEFGQQWALHWLELSGTTESGDSARAKGVWTLLLWLQNVINNNLPYDQFVKALVAGKGSSLENPAITFSANQLPRVQTVPELFLGTRLECAECHDHPFDKWKQADYRSLTEFFTVLGTKEGPHDSSGRELRRFVPPEKFLPWERDKKVTLHHLDGSSVEIPVTLDRREPLADWLIGPAKTLTARAIVNRVWGRLLGRGIIEPVDDMRFSNPPVNEPLLNALANDFLAHNWDFKHLVRIILNSHTYQLSSIPNATNAADEMNFSRARLRRLRAEQLLDSIAQVTGVDETYRSGTPGLRAVQLPYSSAGSRFLTMFGRPTQRMSPCECIRSTDVTLPQVMHLLNGDTVAQRLRSEQSTLAHLLAANHNNDQLIDELYLTVLSRYPTKAEREVSAGYFGESPSRGEGAEDLVWALLNSQEFLFNH
jgi:hypothetical protein